jgi:sialate O-acetylesterase
MQPIATMIKSTSTILVMMFVCSVASADVRLPHLFGDHMILQQESTNAIWGFADPGEQITVTASWGAKVTARADKAGDWKIFLKTPAHGTGHSLVVAGKNSIKISDVAIGEVWLCAGQSNMGWSMGNSFGAEKEANINLPNFRIFKSSREHWHEPLKESRDRLAKWKPCNPKSAAETSAVSYYFGKTLHAKLGIPVGIIVQAYAGTPIEGWMPWEIQKHDPRAKTHKQKYDQVAKRMIENRGVSREKLLATYKQEWIAYNKSIDAGQTMKNKFKQLSPPFITKLATLSHQYPGNICNAMIYPVRPYGIRGMIWYQGERNAKDVPQAAHYREQLPRMIGYFRETWHTLSGGHVAKDFPFYFTQLPSWTPPQTKPVEGLAAPWAVSREMMRLVSHQCANTGMAVAIDTGDAVALHPKNKQPIGIRHAYLALKLTYSKDVIAYGPRYSKQTIQDGKIILQFEADSIGSGLVAASKAPLNAFAIAGKDKVWHWANAHISAGKVVVSSPKVEKPVAVRYAWAMNPSQRNLLYNKEGLPASPFRTDDWPLFDPKAEIVTVVKPEQKGAKSTADWLRPKMAQ